MASILKISLSSHVLDVDAGRPAAGMQVVLYRVGGEEVFVEATDDDGRIPAQQLDIEAGDELKLQFMTGDWYIQRKDPCFYPQVDVAFCPLEPGHYHIPLLINRHGYSTYRGS